MRRTRVKICGVTRPEDALLAVRLGADLVGVNFWPGSPRAVSAGAARRIAEAVAGRAGLVGVFVDQPAEWVEEVAGRVPLDRVQLHGDEGPEEVARFGERAIKVFRLRGAFDRRMLEDYPSAWGFLFDCPHPTLVGGSGSPWSYERIAGAGRERRVLLAGGLRPSNVAAAIRATGAWGVDVCSGVESAAGLKDPAAVERFMREVRDADQEERR